MTAAPVDALRSTLAPAAEITPVGLSVADPAAFQGPLTDGLVRDAVFHRDPASRDAARWAIWAASQVVGCPSASIQDLYLARGRGEFPPTALTVPAINVRAAAYLTARTVFAVARERQVGALVFEIAKSEMAYTDQRPDEYAAVILAAALREGWRGPVFLQGDHFQFNATRWASDPEAEVGGLRDLVREAIGAGFLNIDIDASTLVELSQPTIEDQQRVNAERTADLTRLIRGEEPPGVTISVGGEIGEVGKTNSTEAELRAYLAEYQSALGGDDALAGISKVSIQTGTSHGGVVLPDGSVAPVAIDFDTLTRLSTVAREEFGLAGCVQHGASTLPEEAFGHFPAAGCAEIHLATGFQNILYDEGGLPPDLRAEMMAWCLVNCADERKPGETDEQFLYKTRKKALGPFKEALWSIGPEAEADIRAHLAARLELLFDRLGVDGTRTLVDRYVEPQPLPRPMPTSLGGAGSESIRAAAETFIDDGSGE
ncbi:MAG TPA: class II fructose-bisphosphate aldolase [Gemmatimonadales bacterium]|nr:class II fructose-bisphosphate aldolase [Gemmatimonadales bacterium]